jgi:hypothetical protein
MRSSGRGDEQSGTDGTHEADAAHETNVWW